jgi:plasmid stability protein
MGRETETPEQSARRRLRQAIVDEYLEKLPARLTIRQAAHVLRMLEADVRDLIFRAQLIAREENGSIVILPAENREFLMANMLLRLPSCEPDDPQIENQRGDHT